MLDSPGCVLEREEKALFVEQRRAPPFLAALLCSWEERRCFYRDAAWRPLLDVASIVTLIGNNPR